MKRGPGGLVDIEFIVQFLQLVHAASHPELLKANMWDAPAAGMRRQGIISPSVYTELRDTYDFLRTIEGRLRLIHNRYVSELPEDPAEIARAGAAAER